MPIHKIFPTVIALFCMLLFSGQAIAQNNKINIIGMVTDTTNAPLVAATVLLTQASDSTLAAFTQTDDDGRFLIKNVEQGDYRLQITYIGLSSYSELVDWPTDSELNLGQILLRPENQTLEQVTVEADRIPIQFNKDTINYNADAFKTRPNAVVEDLLKKLPGVQVERDGTVKAQGETVNRVLVDGKEFFGNDPKMATKNLPADAVDKVQVYDKKSDQAEFTGIDDGQEEKTINLELKEDKKKGVFGNLMAGHGDQGRFQSKANLNKFSPKQQLSFIGMANNVNDKGFSIGDYLNLMGGMKSLMSGGGKISLEIDGGSNSLGLPLNFGNNDGFITTLSGGLNFNQEFNDKTEVNGSYFYSNINNDIKRTVDRSTFLSDRTISSMDVTDQDTRNENHRLNFTLDHEISKNHSLKLRTSGNLGNTQTTIANESDQGQAKALNSRNQRNNQLDQNNLSFNTDLLYRMKFNKKGRTLSSNFSFRLGNNDLDGTLESVSSFFDQNDGLISSDTISQINEQTNDQQGYGLRLVYTEPLFKRTYLTLTYDLQQNSDDLDRQVFDRVEGINEFNEQLSNQYKNLYTYHNAGFDIKYNKKDFNLTAGLKAQSTNINGDLILTNTTLDRSFFNWLPSLWTSWDLGTGKSLKFNYNTSVNEPDIQQLQPIIDNSDPFNIYVGNPELRPEFRHRFNASFFLFDQFSMTNFFFNGNYTYTKNRIKNQQFIDEFLIRTTTPVNVADDHMLLGDLSFGTRIKPVKMRINLSSNINYNRGITFVNEIENTTNRTTWTNTLRLENQKKEIIDWTIGAELAWTTSTYSINTAFNQEYTNKNFFADFGFDIKESWSFLTTLDYRIFTGIGGNEAQEVPIWTASISKFFLKDNRGEIKFSVQDILNRNLGINRTADLNFIQEERINNLGRYFMLSFSYKLSGFGEGNQVMITTNKR
jgi:hypothetical protein